MSVYHVCLLPTEVKRGHQSYELHSCELPCGYWELNLCPLVDYPVFLSASGEAKHQSHGSTGICFSPCSPLKQQSLMQGLVPFSAGT